MQYIPLANEPIKAEKRNVAEILKSFDSDMKSRTPEGPRRAQQSPGKPCETLRRTQESSRKPQEPQGAMRAAGVPRKVPGEPKEGGPKTPGGA